MAAKPASPVGGVEEVGAEEAAGRDTAPTGDANIAGPSIKFGKMRKLQVSGFLISFTSGKIFPSSSVMGKYAKLFSNTRNFSREKPLLRFLFPTENVEKRRKGEI